eukprot:scaffold248553_cov21-Tisochrysis_lutea.AAC.1
MPSREEQQRWPVPPFYPFHLQVNFYAHALLTLGVLDRLQLAKGRCVMMASGFEWFLGKMEWDNL